MEEECEAKIAQDSNKLRARRASPSLRRLISRSKSSSTEICVRMVQRKRLEERAERNLKPRRAAKREIKRHWKEVGVETRDSVIKEPISQVESIRTGIMVKEGFSEVAPIITSFPDST